MSDNRIRISWDDIRQPEVDDVVAQQTAWQRSAGHAPEPPPLPSGKYQGPESAQRSLTVTHSAFYLGLCGLAGALLAWLIGEIPLTAFPDPVEQFEEIWTQVLAINDLQQRGEIAEQEATHQIDSLKSRYQCNSYLQIILDPNSTLEVRNTRVNEQLERDVLPRFLRQLLFFVILGSVMGGALSIAEPLLAQNTRACIVNGSVGIAVGTCGGLIVSLFINTLYQSLGGGDITNLSRQILARSLGFGILGLFLSLGPGIVLRNTKRMAIGLAGGCIGGLIGGALFDPFNLLTGSSSAARGLALFSIGGLTGAATGMLEQVMKTGWLQVTHGLIAGKQFILYRNPTTIGSSPQCEIYLFKDPQIAPQHAAISQVNGGFELADLGSASGTFLNGRPIRRMRLSTGDQIQIGGTCLMYQERVTGGSGTEGTR